jgi:hypothetical protein
MIDRWRLEASADNREDVEDQLEAATQAILGHLRDVQPDDEWECTDEQIIPAIDGETGQAIIYGRRVFRRNEAYTFTVS